ncbi:4Fe-4S dicluster domain-containing protein [Telmatobacter bradus]|uniref:4Fe-4S dicluster domain-containing protein n=1 Tax=Telmatobacter bradus TaxID=474953 RepID=UPI003B4349A7
MAPKFPVSAPDPAANLPQSTTLQRIEELGVVGAGGGGFPTAVKLKSRVSTVIANAAECEPLLHKDKELLHHYAQPFLRGMELAMELVGASQGVVGVKEKYHAIIDELTRIAPASIRIAPLPDVYPAGDEFILVHLVTGRVIPPGGLPKDVDVAVSNVETFLNIALDQPVTHKYLTVAGAVANPVTLRVPIGITIGEALEAAGGVTVSDFGVLLGGVMMARPALSLDQPVTKTTGGIIVLPAEHKLIERHRAPWQHVAKIGRSACDQCRFCTEFCPRFLLGHPIEPHMAMRSLGFAQGADSMVAGTLYCCECNLCSLFSCPEDLDPKNVCVHSKPVARERGLTWKGTPDQIEPHPMAEFRRIPTRRLMAKLGLGEFNNVGPLIAHEFHPKQVKILLKQHAGAPAAAVVKTGDRVAAGELLAATPQGQLGARIHASIAGVVRVEKDAVVIEA